MQIYKEFTYEMFGNDRYYNIQGKRLPGVTTILQKTKPFLEKRIIENWRNKVGKEQANLISSEARNRGRDIHQLIEDSYFIIPPNSSSNSTQINSSSSTNSSTNSTSITNSIKINSTQNEMKKKYSGYWESMEKILARVDKIQLMEGCVWTKLYAGRIDCIANFDGIPSIIDFKTSLRPKSKSNIQDYFQQVSAYYYAFNEMYDIEIQQGIVAIAIENKSPQIWILDERELKKSYEAFEKRIAKFYSMTSPSIFNCKDKKNIRI